MTSSTTFMDRTKYNPSKQYQAEEKKYAYTDIFIFFGFLLSSSGSITLNMQTDEEECVCCKNYEKIVYIIEK